MDKQRSRNTEITREGMKMRIHHGHIGAVLIVLGLILYFSLPKTGYINGFLTSSVSGTGFITLIHDMWQHIRHRNAKRARAIFER